ncbi:MAG: T9SS type A sorting domain-containing protein [Bacteroidetes bacterium]|nr:T9SS type A sorting domain-containing protein [Bacteroidota bacterium]
MNANTQEVVKNLFSDTIHIEDEEMTEYYRGYVFSDLIPEDGNVYLQITVEDVSGNGAKYNYVGVYQGESEVADRSGRIDPTNGIFVDFGHGRNPANVLSVKPASYSLAQNYPNPFNPTTTIKYSIPNDGLVQIKVYDISGKEVMNLVNENKTAGNYEVKFNGANLSSGIYFYRINAGEFVQTKRMMLVK